MQFRIVFPRMLVYAVGWRHTAVYTGIRMKIFVWDKFIAIFSEVPITI